MKKIVVNVWGPKPKYVEERMTLEGVHSFRLVDPWEARAPATWAFAVNMDATKWTATTEQAQAYLNIGWILGVLGVAKDAAVDVVVTDSNFVERVA